MIEARVYYLPTVVAGKPLESQPFCADPMHVFDARPGWCKCGEHFWEAEAEDTEPVQQDDG